METKVTCLECGRELGAITTNHLESCCGLTLDEYKQKYPNAETVSESIRYRRSQNCKKLKEKTKILYCSSCGKNPIEVPSQRSSYVCDTCKQNGVESPASKHGKMGSDIVKQRYKDDPSKKQRMADKVSEQLKELFANEDWKNTVIKKRKSTYKERTGYDHYMKNPENVKHIFDKRDEVAIQKTREKTNLKIYGVKTPLADPEFRKSISEKYFKTNGVHHWSQTPEGRKYLRDVGLRRTSKNRVEILENLEIELCDSEYINAHHDHIWLCRKCNKQFKTCWNNIQQGYLCPTCYPRGGGTSIAETEIFNFIQEILPDELILKNDKKTIYPYELDILVPNKKIAIEHNGLMWHSNSIDHDRIDKNYHLIKTNMCNMNGIKLLHIFEDEWLYKKDITKKRIIHILNLSTSPVIHARKCIIKEIDAKIKDAFLNKYHIQGSDISLIRLGAFYNDELISVMTFRKGNISKGSIKRDGVWELNRFCSDHNYRISGIAGRLLKHFQRNYEWKKIYSYADRRWSDGNLYYSLGFDFDYYTQPNYWYIKGYNRINRFNLRKTDKDPKNVPEKLLRLKEGFRILYDCGSVKFSIINE